MNIRNPAVGEGTAALIAQRLIDKDLNTLYGNTYWGKTFYAAVGNSCVNNPSNVSWFGLEVIRGAGAATIQRLTSENILYQRTDTSGKGTSWSNWEEFVTADSTYATLIAGQAQILTDPFVVGVDTDTQTTGYVKFATVSLPRAYMVGAARFEILDKNYVNTQTPPCGVEFSVLNLDANNITLRALLLYGKSDYLSKIYACAKTGSYPITIDFYIDITSEKSQNTVACIKPLFTYYRASNTQFSFITDSEIVSSLPTDTTNTQLSTIYELVTQAASAVSDENGLNIADNYALQDGSYPTLGAGKDGDGNVISETYAKKSEVTGAYTHNIKIDCGENGIVTAQVLSTDSTAFATVDDFISFLSEKGFKVNTETLLPANGFYIQSAGSIEVTYSIVGVG